MSTNTVEYLAELWQKTNYRVVLSGAGMSTESGLPDFRSPGGVWSDPERLKLASIAGMKANPTRFYSIYRQRIENLGNVQPNSGHYDLVRLQARGLLDAIITQNVDGLHQAAGFSKVVELHGNLREAVCLSCQKEYPIRVILENELPVCEICGGMLKPGIILFGEKMPEQALIAADAETKKADLFVVIGSSLEVAPANFFPVQAQRNGAKLIIINREKTRLDDKADLVIRGQCGEILAALVKLTGKG
jgi:NAD-dependent deacetylase